MGLFEQFRLQSAQRGKPRWKLDDILSVSREARLEPYAHIFTGMTIPGALGAFSYSWGRLEPTFRIGRYCSIAASVSQMGMAHPTDWASTSPFSHNPRPLGGFLAYLQDREVKQYSIHDFDFGTASITLGHDVWVGEGALIKAGVAIGDGAIVAARAIVTRTVPPYAIVGGAPARIIRYRFSEELITRMRAAEWWRFGPDVLQPLDVRNPSVFLQRLDDEVARGAKPLDLPVLTGPEIIAAGEPLA